MASQEQKTLKGTPAAPGLAHGKTVIVRKERLEIPDREIEDPEAETERLMEAIKASKVEIDELKDEVSDVDKDDISKIFDAHRMFLEDDALLDRAKDAIQDGQNAEKAMMDAIEHFAQKMEEIANETFKSRAVDIRDVGSRVVGHLMDINVGGTVLTEPAIVVAVDLTPSDTVSLDKDLVLGFCTAEGGPTSHTAILAKTFGLPAVVALGEAILEVSEGTMVLIDGNEGEVTIDPDDETLEDFIEREEQAEEIHAEAREKAQEPAVTADGDRVEVVANVGGVMDAPIGIKNGAEGVGLLRTEFIYLNRNDFPSEAEQIETYIAIFSYYIDMPVIVRALDIGGDKDLPYLDQPEETNPFLGWRGVRMLEEEKDMYKTQFRALLQAGGKAQVDLHIMMPMVAGLEEIKQSKDLMDEVRSELEEEGKELPDDVKFGIMIEVPSAALLADRLAREVDFFSIGTNDLTQYTLAVDRTNRKVANLANPLNPAVLSLIKKTIDSAHAEGKWVGLCGEMAGDPLATPILLGLGLDEFSMAPSRIPVIKQVLRQLKKEDCISLAEEALETDSDNAVQEICRSFLADLGLEF